MNIERLRSKAEKYFENGKWQKALNSYLTLSELEPTNVRVRLRIAENLMRLQKPDEARMIFRDVADFYTRDGQLHKAISLHHRLLEIDRNDREIQNRLAELYQRHGSQSLRDLPANPDDLTEDLKKICSDEITEEWEKLSQIFKQQWLRKDFKVALETLLLRWELNPMDTGNRTQIAKALLYLDRHEEALAVFHHVFIAQLKMACLLKSMFIFSTCHEISNTHPFSKLGEMLKRLSLLCSNHSLENVATGSQPTLFPISIFQKQRTATMDQKVENILLQDYDLEKIQPVEILRHLSRNTCEHLLNFLKPRDLSKGEDLFQQGETNDQLFLLTQGTVDFFADNNVANMTPGREGDYLNLSPFLNEIKHPLTARATDAVEVLSLSRTDCDMLQKNFADFRQAMDRLYNEKIIFEKMLQHPLLGSLTREDILPLLNDWRVEHFEPKGFRIQSGDPVKKLMFLRRGLIATATASDKTPLSEIPAGRFFLEQEALFGFPCACHFENPSSLVVHTLAIEKIPARLRQKISSNSQAKSHLIQRLGI